MARLICCIALISAPAAAQEISVWGGPNGAVATELSYPNENFYYTPQGVISAPKVGNMTIYNGPNGEYLGYRLEGGDDGVQ
jgi:hypothetical protein